MACSGSSDPARPTPQFLMVLLYQWRAPNALYLWYAEVHRRCHSREVHAAGVKLERGGTRGREGVGSEQFNCNRQKRLACSSDNVYATTRGPPRRVYMQFRETPRSPTPHVTPSVVGGYGTPVWKEGSSPPARRSNGPEIKTYNITGPRGRGEPFSAVLGPWPAT